MSIKIITDHTGRSKGFGVRRNGNRRRSQAAIDGLNEKEHLERNMRVSLAQERTDRPAGGNGGNGGGDRRESRGNSSPGGASKGYRFRDNNSW